MRIGLSIKTSVAAAVVMLSSWQAVAYPVFQTGNELFMKCENNVWIDEGFCNGFVSGVADTLSMTGKAVCFPANVTVGQAQAVVVSYLRIHPQDRHLAASSLVAAALKEAFPCR